MLIVKLERKQVYINRGISNNVVFMGTKKTQTTEPKKSLFSSYVSVQMNPSLHGLHTSRFKAKLCAPLLWSIQ